MGMLVIMSKRGVWRLGEGVKHQLSLMILQDQWFALVDLASVNIVSSFFYANVWTITSPLLMPHLTNPCATIALALESTDCDADREVMTELMQLWDGLASSGQDRVVVLAATNRPWDLDPAIQVLVGTESSNRSFRIAPFKG